jgi:hypothetical protein
MSRKFFFQKFIQNNGYEYSDHLSYEENFEELISHLKLYGKGAEKLRKKFENFDEQDFPYEVFDPDYQRFYSDYIKVSKVNSLEKFFKYFEKIYKMKILDADSNYMKKFNYLSQKMNWSNIYNSKYDNLSQMDNDIYEIYLEENLRFHSIKFKKEEKYISKFNKLAEKLYWKNYIVLFKNIIYDLTKKSVENLSKNLEDLQNVILRYKLRNPNKLPKTISECRAIIKNELFVNIYDFVNPKNKRKFNNLRELKSYTIDNDLIFPLNKAKEDFIYKALLKLFFRN